MSGGLVAELSASVFAFAAALYWFKSAAVKLPAPGTYWDSMPESDPWLIATRNAARFNRTGAVFAGLSALSTALTFWIDGKVT
jgi:hypothetical protein